MIRFTCNWHAARAMLTRGHHRESLSLTGPFADYKGTSILQNPTPNTSTQSKSTPAPRPPAMSIKYRFTITYKDEKAARLVPGTISNKYFCALFKADLRAFKIDQPKNETIRLDQRGCVSFTFLRYKDERKNDVRPHLYSLVILPFTWVVVGIRILQDAGNGAKSGC